MGVALLPTEGKLEKASDAPGPDHISCPAPNEPAPPLHTSNVQSEHTQSSPFCHSKAFPLPWLLSSLCRTQADPLAGENSERPCYGLSDLHLFPQTHPEGSLKNNNKGRKKEARS